MIAILELRTHGSAAGRYAICHKYTTHPWLFVQWGGLPALLQHCRPHIAPLRIAGIATIAALQHCRAPRCRRHCIAAAIAARRWHRPAPAHRRRHCHRRHCAALLPSGHRHRQASPASISIISTAIAISTIRRRRRRHCTAIAAAAAAAINCHCHCRRTPPHRRLRSTPYRASGAHRRATRIALLPPGQRSIASSYAIAAFASFIIAHARARAATLILYWVYCGIAIIAAIATPLIALHHYYHCALSPLPFASNAALLRGGGAAAAAALSLSSSSSSSSNINHQHHQSS